jgi:hypothetical protein
MNDPNPYVSPKTDATKPGANCEAHSRTGQAVRLSWYATFAAVLFAGCARAIHHVHHGTYDPEDLLGLLAFLAVASGFGFGVIAVVRAFRCGAVRSILYVALPLLFNGGLLALLLWAANRGPKP